MGVSGGMQKIKEEDTMEKTADFTEGRILSRLLRFALPVLAALFLQAMYGAVDLMVVGQFGAPTDVSAVSTGSQIMQTVTSLITGLAMGITILVGQKIGEKRPEQAGDDRERDLPLWSPGGSPYGLNDPGSRLSGRAYACAG